MNMLTFQLFNLHPGTAGPSRDPDIASCGVRGLVRLAQKAETEEEWLLLLYAAEGVRGAWPDAAIEAVAEVLRLRANHVFGPGTARGDAAGEVLNEVLFDLQFMRAGELQAWEAWKTKQPLDPEVLAACDAMRAASKGLPHA